MTTTESVPLTTPASTGQASLYQQLRAHLAVLKLHDAAEHLPTVLDAAHTEGLTLTAALERLLAIEVDANQARRLAGRIRFASLPTPATLTDFDYDAAPGVDPALINELATGRYLQQATNVLLIGPPGVGKTHLAVGLARSAAEAGYRTYFTTAADLAARCHRAAIEGRWATTMRFFAGPTCLVIDELGYLPLPAEAASALFQVVSQRYLKTSIILTSNKGVGSWGEVLGDTAVAASPARPAPAPLRRAQPRRRLLPPTSPPRPRRSPASHHHRHPPTTTLTPPPGEDNQRSNLGIFDERHHGLGGDQQHLGEQRSEGVLAVRAEPRDRAVVGDVLGAQHPERHIRGAQPLDLTRGPHPAAVGVHQQTQQHPGVIPGRAHAAEAAASVERAGIHRVQGVQQEPHQVIRREPLTHIRGQEKRLVTQHRTVRVGHTPCSQTGGPQPHHDTPFRDRLYDVEIRRVLFSTNAIVILSQLQGVVDVADGLDRSPIVRAGRAYLQPSSRHGRGRFGVRCSGGGVRLAA